jgi:hypothetical protein
MLQDIARPVPATNHAINTTNRRQLQQRTQETLAAQALGQQSLPDGTPQNTHQTSANRGHDLNVMHNSANS